MSQTTLTSFYNSRKRPATDDIVTSKSKLAHVDSALETTKCVRKTAIKNSRAQANSSVKQENGLHRGKDVTEVLQNSEVVETSLSSSSSTTVQTSTKLTVFAKKANANNAHKGASSKIESVSLARKELSLGDIKKKLAGSSRLAELKARAEQLSKGIQELKETSSKRNLKEFKSIDVEVPQSPRKSLIQKELQQSKEECVEKEHVLLLSPRKVVVSPVKSPSKVPAYIKHASLANASSSLPLPHHYRSLAELFRGMETVVALLFNRNEKITFNKLKPSVQEMLKKNFNEKHLAQIKHLVPDFYNFTLEKVKTFAKSSQKDAYELIITPNFPNDIKLMNPNVLLERRRFFYDTLLKLTKKHHSQYLSTLDPPMVIPDNKLNRWHPEFEVEKVPEVECGKLPEMPNTEKLSTAQDVLAKARQLFKCNTKMERALEKLAQAKARGLTDEEKKATGINDNKEKSPISTGTQTPQPSTSGVTILNPALRNLPAALLEKVKAKQAAKALEAMTRSSDYQEKYFIYSRLPDLARTLRNIFVTERKNVLALNIILSKLDSSFKANVSASDLQRDIKLLTEEVPELVKLHDVRNTTYLKLDKTADLKKIITKLEVLAAKYKNE